MGAAVKLSQKQGDAIFDIVDWYKNGPQEFYLAGYAGTGKSTLVEHAIQELKSSHGISKVYTAAYTGKASSVLRKKGVEGACTIHSLIYTPVIDEVTGKLEFIISEESAAYHADLIVLDECSMIDERMADDLRSFGKKILVIGDPGQLPPVKGQGAFTSREPDLFLTEIHRQAADSPILELATMARQGKRLPVGYNKNNVKVLTLDKNTQRLIYEESTQPICGKNNVRYVYTQRIRKIRGFDGGHPEIGETLICCRNNWRRGIYNGGLGKLKSIDAHPSGWLILDVADDEAGLIENLEVDPHLFERHFGENAEKLEIDGKRFDEFDWGYVLTCHKAQGSSWNHVTIIDDSGAFRENRLKWLYTALTRAETGLTLLMRQ